MIISSWPGWRWKSWPSPGSSETSITTSCFDPVFAGRQRQPIVPQSNSSCSTSRCLTKVLNGSSSVDGNRLEAAHVLGHRDLGRQALHRRGAEEADDAVGVREDVCGVVGLGNRASVAQDENLRVDTLRGVVHRLHELHRLRECLRRFGADRTAGGEPHVRDEDVGACLGHRGCLVLVEDVRGREEFALVSEPDHLDLEAEAHPRLLESAADRAVEKADGGEVLDAAEADPAQLVEEHGHQPKRVGPADAGEDGRLLHDRKHLARHVDDDRVRVAVREQPGERPAPAHSVAAGVVDDDQVGAAGLGQLRREAGARARADDRRPRLDLSAQPRERLVPRHRVAPSWIAACRRSAIAVANAGSLMSVSTSCTSTASPSVSCNPASSAASASVSWNGWPSTAIIETPFSGTNSAVGPVARDSFRPMRRPSSAHSSGVVRISVTVGLCTYRFRVSNFGGTVSRGPKLTMSSAPSETTCGTPAAPAASRRSGPADSTPPTSSSASSVVVVSSTPARNPSRTSASSDWPPAPVAWKTSTS